MRYNDSIDTIPWTQVIKNKHLLKSLSIDLIEKVFKNLDKDAFYNIIDNTNKGGVRGINFFAIGMQYNTEIARELYELVKMIGFDGQDTGNYELINQLILHMPTISGIESGFDKYSLTYRSNYDKWEPLGSIEVPGFSQYSGNNNRFNAMAGEFLDYLLYI